eukprot:1058383-Pleurochrysis_carterae.AAC.3
MSGRAKGTCPAQRRVRTLSFGQVRTGNEEVSRRSERGRARQMVRPRKIGRTSDKCRGEGMVLSERIELRAREDWLGGRKSSF